MNNAKIVCIPLERANIAANALIAQQAAAARLLMASQALAECREQNNPYLPGNSLFGPTRTQMWGPDPCQTQMKELAGATTAHQDAVALAQRSAAPTAQDLAAAPAPQLSETFSAGSDPAIPETELVPPSPALSNMWSPDTVLEIMNMLAEQMEIDQPGSTSSSDMEEEMELIYSNMVAFLSWDCWEKPKRRRKRFVYQPNNQDWIGRWIP